jgi:hypothetical protein
MKDESGVGRWNTVMQARLDQREVGGGGGGGWQHFKQNGCWFSPPIVLFIYFCKNYKIIKQNKIKCIF